MQIEALNQSGETALRVRDANLKSENANDKKQSNEIDKFIKSKSDELAQADLQLLQAKLAAHDIALKFTRDDETKAVVVQLINTANGEPIRQIPSEVSLKLIREIGKLQGWFLNEKA